MKRMRHAFQGLRWRLALSYILVTVVAAITVQLAVVAATAIPAQFKPRTGQADYRGIAKQIQLTVELQLGPYLDRQPPDSAAINHLLTYSMNPANLKNGPVGIDLYKAAFAAVFDPAGHELASVSAPGASTGDLITAPLAQTVIRAALAQSTDYAHLTGTLPDGHPVIAVPLTSYDGHFVGVFFGVFLFTDNSYNVVQVNGQSLQDYLVSTTTNQVLPDTLWITLVAILAGTLFGLLTSRGITRRLRRLAAAADDWSRGELGVTVHDRSQDEVGQLSRHLNTMAEQLRTLLVTRQELAIVDERNRLARDLHDSVKQEVFATAMQVAAARTLMDRDPAAAKVRLAQAEQLVGQAQGELTALILELRPAALAGKGVGAALRDYCAEWSRQTRIAAEVRLLAEQATPLAVEQTLFRVAQEALANVARHSSATTVDVHLVWAEQQVCLTIDDNGHGFDGATAAGHGIGLRSMRERVEALDGTLLIASTSSGTRVDACVPLPERPASASVAGITSADAVSARIGGGV